MRIINLLEALLLASLITMDVSEYQKEVERIQKESQERLNQGEDAISLQSWYSSELEAAQARHSEWHEEHSGKQNPQMHTNMKQNPEMHRNANTKLPKEEGEVEYYPSITPPSGIPVSMKVPGPPGPPGFNSESQIRNVEAIVNTCKEHSVSLGREIAYILGTAQLESRLEPVREEGRGVGEVYGQIYYGRGFVQLTYLDNYRKMEIKLREGGFGDVDLVGDPDRALEPQIAAFALVVGMRDGMFTGRTLSTYIRSETDFDYIGARSIVNDPTLPYELTHSIPKLIADYANDWYTNYLHFYI